MPANLHHYGNAYAKSVESPVYESSPQAMWPGHAVDVRSTRAIKQPLPYFIAVEWRAIDCAKHPHIASLSFVEGFQYSGRLFGKWHESRICLGIPAFLFLNLNQALLKTDVVPFEMYQLGFSQPRRYQEFPDIRHSLAVVQIQRLQQLGHCDKSFELGWSQHFSDFAIGEFEFLNSADRIECKVFLLLFPEQPTLEARGLGLNRAPSWTIEGIVLPAPYLVCQKELLIQLTQCENLRMFASEKVLEMPDRTSVSLVSGRSLERLYILEVLPDRNINGSVKSLVGKTYPIRQSPANAFSAAPINVDRRYLAGVSSSHSNRTLEELSTIPRYWSGAKLRERNRLKYRYSTPYCQELAQRSRHSCRPVLVYEKRICRNGVAPRGGVFAYTKARNREYHTQWYGISQDGKHQ